MLEINLKRASNNTINSYIEKHHEFEATLQDKLDILMNEDSRSNYESMQGVNRNDDSL